MKKILLIVVAFAMFANPAYSKEKPPKKRGKQVFIEFRDKTTINAILWKNEFAEGPMKVNFYDGSNIEGIYHFDFIEQISYIDGKMYYPENGGTVYGGRFAISNDKTEFSPKRSKKRWTVNADIRKIEIADSDCKVIARKSNNPTQYNVTAVTSENRVDSITFSRTMGNIHSMIGKNPARRRYRMSRYELSSKLMEALATPAVSKTVYFANGDVYEGRLLSYSPIQAESSNGEYSYKPGGKITGKFHTDFTPLSGTIRYGNGDSETQDKFWPHLSVFQIRYLLFTVRESLENITLLNENEGERIAEARLREQERIAEAKRQEEKRIAEEELRLAEEKRLEEERIEKAKKQEELRLAEEKRQEELKEQRENEAKRQGYIRKYGAKWGELVFNRKITLGMTIAMCADIVDKSWYDISYYEHMEIWSYNPQKTVLANPLAKLILMSVGLDDSQVHARVPKMFTFVNGKLKGFEQ